MYLQVFEQACHAARERGVVVITPSLETFRKVDGVHLHAETCAEGLYDELKHVAQEVYQSPAPCHTQEARRPGGLKLAMIT